MVLNTTCHLPDLTRRIPVAHSTIEEIVEGFVEGFFLWASATTDSQSFQAPNRNEKGPKHNASGLPMKQIAFTAVFSEGWGEEIRVASLTEQRSG